jgi:hypothetical protein
VNRNRRPLEGPIMHPRRLDLFRAWRAGALLCVAIALACGGDEGREADSTSTSLGTSLATTMSESGEVDDDEGESTVAGSTGSADDETSTSGTDDGVDPTEAGTTGEPEYFMFADPLIGGTMGTQVGGEFSDAGWTVTANADRIFWHVPRLVEGSVEFTVANITIANIPLDDHEIFAMYEGGHGMGHPINYNPEYRVNNYKTMIRIYGQTDTDRVGQQKIMWGMCPDGAPGYHEDGPCACASQFFGEPYGGDPNGDGSPQRLRVEWADGFTRYLRNGVVVLEIDWSTTGLSFAPQELYVSIGTPRPEDVAGASMPIGAVFTDLVIEGWTGPEASCG